MGFYLIEQASKINIVHSPISDLPLEILTLIFMNLEFRDLVQCSYVSHSWNKVTKINMVWKPFFGKYHVETWEEAISFCKRNSVVISHQHLMKKINLFIYDVPSRCLAQVICKSSNQPGEYLFFQLGNKINISAPKVMQMFFIFLEHRDTSHRCIAQKKSFKEVLYWDNPVGDVLTGKDIQFYPATKEEQIFIKELHLLTEKKIKDLRRNQLFSKIKGLFKNNSHDEINSTALR